MYILYLNGFPSGVGRRDAIQSSYYVIKLTAQCFTCFCSGEDVQWNCVGYRVFQKKRLPLGPRSVSRERE